MPRWTIWPLGIACLIFGLLFTATLFLWARSRSWAERYSWPTGPGRQTMWVSNVGAIEFVSLASAGRRGTSARSVAVHSKSRGTRVHLAEWLERFGIYQHNRLGSPWRDLHRAELPRLCAGGYSMMGSRGPPVIGTTTMAGLIVQDWLIAAISGSLALVCGVRLRGMLIRWRRGRGGRCLACGYDIRATPGRCPECGATPETSAN